VTVIISLGETMLRLSVRDGDTLEGASTYQVHVAGAESSVAVALARLGLASAWVSRLPDNALGHKVAGELRRHGVDLSRVVWAPPSDRQATFFVEFGPAPRGTEVIYDRANSAFSRIQPDEVDWSCLRQARWLHLTGITPALGDGPRATVERALAEAHAAGVPVSFDVNYRARLWSPEAAAGALAPLVAQCAVLICSLRDAVRVLGASDDPETALMDLHARFRPAVTVLTLGERGAIAFDTELHRQPALAVETVDPLGTGDAFAAGFIAGYLEAGVAAGLAWGTALAALKRTYRGDLVWCTRSDLLAVLRAAPSGEIRR
jgi:2-dehydro-3-deoxygluconokinase